MSPDTSFVCLSAIDEERFGIRTARTSRITLETLPLVMDFCRSNGVTFLIARSLVSDLRVAQAMEREGFVLMDTLVHYERDLLRTPIPSDSGRTLIRPMRSGEEERVKAVASESFRGYLGHYHADDRLDRTKCDEAYVSWAFRSCVSRDVADEVLVAELANTIIGFFALQLKNSEEGTATVGGVLPSAQGHGIYRSFMIHGMAWCLSKRARRMIVSTQITNVGVQKVWARLGFEFSHAYYTFHKWFD